MPLLMDNSAAQRDLDVTKAWQKLSRQLFHIGSQFK